MALRLRGATDFKEVAVTRGRRLPLPAVTCVAWRDRRPVARRSGGAALAAAPRAARFAPDAGRERARRACCSRTRTAMGAGRARRPVVVAAHGRGDAPAYGRASPRVRAARACFRA